MTPSDHNQSRALFLNVAAQYLSQSIGLRRLLQQAEKNGLADQLAQKPVELHRTNPAQANHISRKVGAPVRAWVLANTPPEKRWFDVDVWQKTLLAKELDDGIFPRELILASTHAESTDGSIDVNALAQDIDPQMLTEMAKILHPSDNHQLQFCDHSCVLALCSYGASDDVNKECNTLFSHRRAQVKLIKSQQKIIQLFHPDSDLQNPVKTRPNDAVSNQNIAQAKKEHDMTANGSPEAAHHVCNNEIADAISRLQDSLGTSTQSPTTTGAQGFETVLQELQYATLSIPSLQSEAALSMGPRKLADKIVHNLSLAVNVAPSTTGQQFQFRPRHIRGLDATSGGALGGAGIVAHEVDALRVGFIARMEDLKPQICLCDEKMPDSLINEAEDLLIQLAQEAAADTGPFQTRVETLMSRLSDSVIELCQLYGISLPDLSDLSRETQKRIHSSACQLQGAHPIKSNTTKQLHFNQGVLIEDANDEAVRSIFTSIDRVHALLLGDGRTQLGAIYARLAKRVDAIAPSVQDLRQALRRAGVSLVDQKASFVEKTAGNTEEFYELDRLLTWIDDSAMNWHADLMEGALSRRSLRWMASSLNNMHDALCAFSDAKHESSPLNAAAPRNAYGTTRRQLNELSGLLLAAKRDAASLGRETHQRSTETRQVEEK